MPMIVFAGAMKLAQRALEVLNLALVIDLLTLGQLQRFQHFFHFFERMFQLLNDAVDLVNGFGNRRLLVLLLRFGMVPSFSVLVAFVTLRSFGALMAFGSFTAFGMFAAFTLLCLLCVFRVFGLFAMLNAFGVLLVRILRRFCGGFGRRFLVFCLRRRGSLAGRGQGTAGLAITAAAGMASATAPGSAPATRGGRI